MPERSPETTRRRSKSPAGRRPEHGRRGWPEGRTGRSGASPSRGGANRPSPRRTAARRRKPDSDDDEEDSDHGMMSDDTAGSAAPSAKRARVEGLPKASPSRAARARVDRGSGSDGSSVSGSGSVDGVQDDTGDSVGSGESGDGSGGGSRGGGGAGEALRRVLADPAALAALVDSAEVQAAFFAPRTPPVEEAQERGVVDGDRKPWRPSLDSSALRLHTLRKTGKKVRARYQLLMKHTQRSQAALEQRWRFLRMDG